MDHTQTVADTIKELLEKLGLDIGVEIETRHDPEGDIYQVLLHSTKPALLIGYHGETLSSIQMILGQHLHSRIGQWLNLSVNVNDYRERRESSLTALADTVVAEVVSTGQPHSLPPMPANERRIIHIYLADNPQVSTSSEGSGHSRGIIVSPKTS